MITYVVDASVAARFLLVEELSDNAGQILKDFLDGVIDLRTPQLLVYEVGNALSMSVLNGFITVHEAGQKLHSLLKLKMNILSLDEKDHQAILAWSTENEVTYYDGAYVISSKKIGAPLITADDLLYEKAKRKIPVVHLREYS